MTSSIQLKEQYKKGRKRKIIAIFSIIIAIIITFVISISFGAGSPGFTEAMNVILSKLFPTLGFNPMSNIVQIIILSYRLPRVILALIAGAGLAASGAVMQGVLRNPLVSSYTLGISSAAGFGAALAVILGFSVIGLFSNSAIVINAFIFSMVAMVFVYAIARLRGTSSSTVILAGVAISYLFGALISLVQYLAPSTESSHQLIFWLMGGLGAASWQNISLVLPIVMVTAFIMLQQSWNINVLSMGESVATSLGVNSSRVLNTSMVLSTLATACIIAFTGVIGFVDLISPHIARMMVGSDHRFLIPTSALLGALILLCSDTLARLIIMPSELPVGVVTSLLGVPFFLYMLLSKRRQGWN